MWYNILAGNPGHFAKGGDRVEIILSLLISVEAGLLVELIRTWLDGSDR